MKNDVMRETPIGETAEVVFNFDLEKLQHALNSPTISLPQGLTGEQRWAFLRKRLNEIDQQAKLEIPT